MAMPEENLKSHKLDSETSNLITVKDNALQIPTSNSELKSLTFGEVYKLIPLAFSVFKAEMLQTEDLNLRHKAASEVINIARDLSGSATPNQGAPLVNLNFPEGYIQKTFSGVSNLFKRGEIHDKPKSAAEIAKEYT